MPLRLGLENHVTEEKSTCFVSVNISGGLSGQKGEKANVKLTVKLGWQL